MSVRRREGADITSPCQFRDGLESRRHSCVTTRLGALWLLQTITSIRLHVSRGWQPAGWAPARPRSQGGGAVSGRAWPRQRDRVELTTDQATRRQTARGDRPRRRPGRRRRCSPLPRCRAYEPRHAAGGRSGHTDLYRPRRPGPDGAGRVRPIDNTLEAIYEADLAGGRRVVLGRPHPRAAGRRQRRQRALHEGPRALHVHAQRLGPRLRRPGHRGEPGRRRLRVSRSRSRTASPTCTRSRSAAAHSPSRPPTGASTRATG